MRISIRYQTLGLVLIILVAALAAYLYFAIALVTQDKLAYVFDLNSSLASTVSEEVRAGMGSLVDKLKYFAAAQTSGLPLPGGDPHRRARIFFENDADVLSVEIWRVRADGRFDRVYRFVDPERLASLDVSEEELAESRRTRAVPLEVVVAQQVLLQNASLPPNTAILSLAAASADQRQVVIADVRPDRFLRVLGRSTLYRVYVVDARGNILVHPDAAVVVARENVAAVPVVRAAIEGKLARGAQEFEGPGGATLGAFAAVGLGRLSVVAEVPRDEALRASRELVRRSVLFALAVLFVGLLASIFFSRRLTAPLRRLEEATVAVARGEFAVGVPVQSRNEIGRLAEAFNRMSRELADRDERLADAHDQALQAEKLSVLGEMSASIVHEVKNPLVGIVGFAQMGATASSLAEAKEYFGLIEGHSWRANEILQNLLKFARQEDAPFEALDPNAVVRGAVRLVAHQMQLKRVQVETRFTERLPPILGNANQLQQVLVNLMMNAQHAMDGRAERRLVVSTARADGSGIRVAVADTGAGMSEEVRRKLFTPFFTTKARGQGTGLGLSVSARIVKQHGGEIGVESEEGRGTTFSIRLPATSLAPTDSGPATGDGEAGV